MLLLMEALHQSNANGRLISSSNVVPSIDENEAAASIGKASKDYWETNSQSVIVLLIMVAVLLFILTYCLWGTPWCRYIFRRRLCPCLSTPDDMTISSGSITPRTYSSTGHVNNSRAYRGAPTIILLPQGRMLVVDGSVIAQFRADTQGVDLMELGQSIAWQRHQSTPSIMSSGTADSKDGISPIIPLTRFSPPSYESLFGNQMALQEGLYDLPPSYSEINFQLQQLNNALSREFSNLSGERQRTHTSESNLARRQQNLENRRYRSVDLLENQNDTERYQQTLHQKIPSEGDIIDSGSNVVTSSNNVIIRNIPFSNNADATIAPRGAVVILTEQTNADTVQDTSSVNAQQYSTNRIHQQNPSNSAQDHFNNQISITSNPQMTFITSSSLQFDENIRESRV